MIGRFAGHPRKTGGNPMDLGFTGKHASRAQGQT